MTEIVQTIVVRGSEEGLTALTAKLREYAAEGKNVAMVSDDMSKRSISLLAAWNKTGLTLNENARSLDTYTRLVKQSANTLKQGSIDAQMHADRVALLTEKYDKAGVSAQRMITGMSGLKPATAELVAVSKSFDKLTIGMSAAGDASVASSQKMISGMTMATHRMMSDMSVLKQTLQETAKATTKSMSGMVTGMTAAGDFNAVASQKMISGMTRAADVSTAANQRLIAGMSGMRTEAARAATEINKPLSEMVAGMTKAGDVGAVASQRIVTGMSVAGNAAARAAEQHAQSMTKIAAGSQQAAKAAALTSYEMLNFGRQTADVIVSLQAGQSPFTVMVQQGTQFLDILKTSGAGVGAVFRQVGGVVARFATSAAGVATGLAAIGGAAVYAAHKWNEGKVDVQRSLMGIGQQSGATAGQLEDIAEAAAKNTKITMSGARELLAALAQTGKVGVEQMTALTNSAHDFAKVFGVEMPEAIKIMTEAFADPAQGVDMLATRFRFVAKDIENVKRLAAQGNLAGAQNALKSMVDPQLKDVEKASSTISKIWEGTKKVLDTAWIDFNKGLDRAAGNNTLVDQLNQARKLLQSFELKALEGPVLRPPGEMRPQAKLQDEFNKSLEEARKNVEELEKAVAKTGSTKALTALAKDALKIADAIDPGVQKFKAMEDALDRINKVLSSPAEMKGMDQGQVKQLQQSQKLLQDQVGYVRQIRKEYSGVRDEVGKQLDILTAQAAVAGARSQAEQLSAQFAVDYKTAMAQGATAAEAVQVANKQRAVTVASIAKQERNMVQASQDQLAIAQQTTNEGRAKAEAEATYNQLLAQNVSAGTAATVAANQHAAATTQIAKQEKDVVQASTDQLGISREVTLQGKARAASQATYNQLIAQGVSEETAATVAANQHKAAQIEINRQAENIVGSLSDQADVASAIGGRAKVNAQAQATYNDMVRQGYDASMALAASEETRRAGLGAINAAMAEQLASLQDQGMVAGASTGAQKIAAQSQAAYNKAIRDGASETQAAAIAQQVYANGVAAANAAVENQIYEVNKAADIARVAGTSMEAATKAAWAYSDALRSGADEAHAFALEQAVLNAETAKFNKQSAQTRAQEAGGKYLQFVTDFGRMIAAAKEAYGEGNYESTFSMQGYETVTPTLDWMGTKLFGEDNYKINKQTKTVLPSDEYLGNALFGEGNYKTDKGMISPTGELLANALLQREGSLSGAVNTMIQKMDLRDTDYTGTIERVIGLLPKEQQIDPLKAEIEKVKQLPVTLAREELLKSLNDSLKSLEESVDANTEAKMDPLFSQGHEFINQLKIGYYKAAEGGIFGPGGPMRLMPVNRYASGGIASSPQMAMFGEAGPEAFIPLKGGAVPVTIKTGGASNDNSKNITQNITQNITINTTPADRLTGRQRAQGFITAATNAAAAA